VRLEELTVGLVSRAIGAYLELAYSTSGAAAQGALPSRRDLNLPPDAGKDEILALFQCEAEAEERAGRPCVRYTMRLGNRNYPFMKLLLQEHIVPGEFYFAVDTHDDMDIKPDFPDYDAWMAVRRFNGELKKRIEARFAELGIPTASTLREVCRVRGGDAGTTGEAGTVLVVDDEEDLAAAVASVLEAKGYRTRIVHDGAAGLAAAAEMQPDLVLLDYELPELDGLEVLARLREDPATRDIPVLLCTAGKIGVGDIRRADGFLAKPYSEDLLHEMVQRLTAAGRGVRER